MPCNNCYTSVPKPKYPVSWFIETLCKLCRKMTYIEIKNNGVLDWYIEHLESDYNSNTHPDEKESAKKELERMGEKVSI